MSVALGTGDYLYRNTAFIGAELFSVGGWFRFTSDTNDYADLITICTALSDPGIYLSVATEADGTTVYGAGSQAGETASSYGISLDTWYYMVLSGNSNSSTVTLRIFDDSTSTTPLLSVNFPNNQPSLTSWDYFVLGTNFTGESFIGEITSVRVITGANWTNAEARTESQSFDNVKSGVTVQGNWRLKTTTADADGINDSSGNGYNLTNGGASNGASVPTQLTAGGTTLTVADAAHGHAAEAPALAQANVLVVADAAQAHAAEGPLTLSTTGELAPADATHAHAAESPTLLVSRHIVLGAPDISAAPSALSFTVTVGTESVALTVAISDLTLTQAIILAVADATHAHAVESPDLTQANVLAADDTLHAQAAEQPTLSSAGALAPADAAHAHVAEAPTLTQRNVLAIAETLHAHAAETPDLTQANLLAVAETLHAQAAENVGLSSTGTLAVADALHGHATETPGLTQANLLALNDGTHAQVVDIIGLIQANILTVAEALHAHTAEGPIDLSTAAFLSVADVLHAHLADAPALLQHGILSVAGALHTHAADNIGISGLLDVALSDSTYALPRIWKTYAE